MHEALILILKNILSKLIFIIFLLLKKRPVYKKIFHVSSHCTKLLNNYFLSDPSIPKFRSLHYN